MKINKIILTFLLLFIFSQSAFALVALDYTAEINYPPNVDVYQGETIVNDQRFKLFIKNNGKKCDISCEYSTSMGTSSGGKNLEVRSNEEETYLFDVETEGISGQAVGTIRVTCERIIDIKKLCWEKSPESKPPRSFSFSYLYNGDGICTTDREKCSTYLKFMGASQDCACGPDKKCIPQGERTADKKGCVTKCGDKIVQKEYEDCSNCPNDVGKCDGDPCISK